MSLLPWLPIALVTLIAIALTIVVMRLRRTSPTGDFPFFSHLICPRCGANFDYSWIPFMSITAIRMFDSRFFACPVCGRHSVFNVWATRVDPRSHHCEIQIGPW